MAAAAIETILGEEKRPAIRAARFYKPELDVLRFFAFLAVFLQHSFQHTPAFYYPKTHRGISGAIVSTLAWSGGYGVDLFFVLSAFLITQLLVREQEEIGALDVKRFYMRRILRIWPLYFFFLGVIAIGGIWFEPIHASARWLMMYLLLSGNLAHALWGWAPTFAMGHLWSIAVEEQFYLLWPLFVRGRRRRELVIAAIAVWTSTLTRLDPIAGGILLGILTMDKTPELATLTRMSLMTGGILTMFVVSAWCDPYHSPNSAVTIFFGYPAVSLGCAAILISILGVKVQENRLIGRAGIYLGKISYGLYVWHVVALILILSLLAPMAHFAGWAQSSVLAAVCALGLTIAISAASYRYLENPFLKLKSRYALIPSRPR
jgi:peptidoglycan/LPS O-acetylase OafA/YrhL